MSTLGYSLDRLEAEGEYERAATIALFNLQMRRAIQTLNRGATKTQSKIHFVKYLELPYTNENTHKKNIKSRPV